MRLKSCTALHGISENKQGPKLIGTAVRSENSPSGVI